MGRGSGVNFPYSLPSNNRAVFRSPSEGMQFVGKIYLNINFFFGFKFILPLNKYEIIF